MNKTQKLADEKFNGDINEAIKYVLHNTRGDEMLEYINEWTPDQARFALDYIYQLGEEKMGKKGLRRMIDEEVSLEALGVTREEVLTSAVNPYASPLRKKLLIIVLAFVIIGIATVVPGLLEIPSDYETVISVVAVIASGVLVCAVLLTIFNDISGFFRYRSLKKQLTKDETEEKKAEE